MISIILTSILILVFLFSGHLVDGLKKLVKLITSSLLKLLNFFGIRLKNKEKSIKVSKEFKQTYKDIKVVKLSNKNLKQESSIDYVYLTIFLVAVILVVVNFGAVSGNAITNWIYSSVIQSTFLGKFITSAANMNTLYTAMLFSILTFSSNKVLKRWRDTKQYRIETHNEKIKNKAKELMTEKELLNAARDKTEQKEKNSNE